MLFFGKVRIDLEKLPELGAKLESGELDMSHCIQTYCIKDDPSVGINIWEAENLDDLEEKLNPHRPYYSEVFEIFPIILPEESKAILME